MHDRLIPYMRQSRRRERTISIDEQRRDIAKVRGVKLLPEVVEQNVSGNKPWRQRALGEAIARCERGEADGIIVAYQDRLSRENGLATAEVWDALDKAGARLVCVNDGIDTATGDQELTFAIKAAIARDQWKRYAQRFEAAKRNAVERGIQIARPPFGYVRQGTARTFELVPRAADAVRAAFELRATGATYGEVRRLLDLRAPGGPSGRGAWTSAAVGRLLRNRVYLGEVRDGLGHAKAHAHPAIVDAQVFDTVQALARLPERSAQPREVREGARMLLAGVTQCGSCGYALARKMSGGYETYACLKRSASGRCPNAVTIIAHNLDAYIVEEVVLPALAERAHAIKDRRTQADVQGLHASLEAARRKRAPFEDPDYVDALGLEAAKRALVKVDAEIAECELRLADAVGEQHASDDEVILLTPDAFRSLSVEQQRMVVGSMIEAVTVYPSGGKRGTAVADRVAVTWRGDQPPVARPPQNGSKVVTGIDFTKGRAQSRKPKVGDNTRAGR